MPTSLGLGAHAPLGNPPEHALLSRPGRQFTQASPRDPSGRELNLPLTYGSDSLPRNVARARLARRRPPAPCVPSGLRARVPHEEAPAFAVPELSAFVRSLGRTLAERGETTPPGHVELLNLVARAAGNRNVQALRASMQAPPVAVTPSTGRRQSSVSKPPPASTEPAATPGALRTPAPRHPSRALPGTDTLAIPADRRPGRW